MTKEETLELIEFLNNMSNKDFTKILKETEKEIFTKEYYEELNKEEENDKTNS